MIPKIIHYCWFGGNPLPPLALECIASWKKFFPDYEIREWNETNFDVNSIPYTAEAYKQKKYAFVSDYCRFYVMEKYGGVYFDTDVEVIKPMDDIIQKGAFMGYELNPNIKKKIVGQVAPGLGFAFPPHHPLVQELLNYYEELTFNMQGGNIKTIVGHTTDVLVSHGLKACSGIQHIMDTDIYPAEYLCPIHNVTKRLHITENTRSIHRYMDSWNDKKKGKTKKDIIRMYIPEWILLLFNSLKNK